MERASQAKYGVRFDKIEALDIYLSIKMKMDEFKDKDRLSEVSDRSATEALKIPRENRLGNTL